MLLRPICLLLCLLWAIRASAEIPAAPERAEGEGPYRQLILRGATLVDGTGAPAVSGLTTIFCQRQTAESHSKLLQPFPAGIWRHKTASHLIVFTVISRI